MPAAPGPQLQVERRELAGGSELLTVFGRLPEARQGITDPKIPLLALLRDPQSRDGRLCYVWVLTSSQPTPLQRAAAAVPFFYWRAGAGKNADRTPRPLMDLGSAGSRVWKTLGGSVA